MADPTRERPSFLARWCPNSEWVLFILLALEIFVFSATGTNFLSVENGFEITRLAAEVGLLAFGLTLVIKTGGIDLSVGSMMGLSAVVLGASWSTLGLPIWIAALLTIAMGAAGGLLNGLLITRLNVPPLIVTLGTFSLYRGLAEAATGGYVSYTGFSPSFLALGQGYVGGVIPTQLFLFAVVFMLLWLVLHRRVVGREITAIGFNPGGARYAGVRVDRRTLMTYVVSGICAALAGIVYVARIGQAKADAGTGYELLAIAAVVLGGTSIAGGRGTLHGTLLGLLGLVVLQNGLRMSGQPSEIAGLFAGLVLLVAIGLNQLWARSQRASLVASLQTTHTAPDGELDMKNSQVTLIIGAIIVGAVLIAGSNLFLARSLTSQLTQSARSSGGPAPAEKIIVAMTPKATADPYFVSVKEGVEEAAAQLGVEILWDGPTDPDPAKQNEIVEAWITRGVDVIAASPVSPAAISTVLKKAQERGIKVLTWDADAPPDSRAFFVNQATARGIGYTLADEGGRLAGGTGQYAIITASLTDANQNEWIKYINERMAAEYPQMSLAAVHPSAGQRDKAMTEARNIIRAYPNVKVIIAVAAPAVPGAAEGLKQEGRTDVRLTGLSTPNLSRDYIKEGWLDSVVLWKTADLGYLTVYAAQALHEGTLSAGDDSIRAGRLGEIAIEGDNILLGEPFVFNKGNIDNFNF